MPRNSIKYMHPKLGEIWIQRGCLGEELFSEKKFNQLNKHLEELYVKCYGQKK